LYIKLTALLINFVASGHVEHLIESTQRYGGTCGQGMAINWVKNNTRSINLCKEEPKWLAATRYRH